MHRTWKVVGMLTLVGIVFAGAGRAVPSSLSGTWQGTDALGNAWTVELGDDGTFTLTNAGGEVDVQGTFVVKGNTIRFRDQTFGVGVPCGTGPYKYKWKVRSNTLSFKKVSDKCPDRWLQGLKATSAAGG